MLLTVTNLPAFALTRIVSLALLVIVSVLVALSKTDTTLR